MMLTCHHFSSGIFPITTICYFRYFIKRKGLQQTHTHTQRVWVDCAIATLTKQIEAIASLKESFLLHLNVLLIRQSSDIRLLYWNFQFFAFTFYPIANLIPAQTAFRLVLLILPLQL